MVTGSCGLGRASWSVSTLRIFPLPQGGISTSLLSSQHLEQGLVQEGAASRDLSWWQQSWGAHTNGTSFLSHGCGHSRVWGQRGTGSGLELLPGPSLFPTALGWEPLAVPKPHPSDTAPSWGKAGAAVAHPPPCVHAGTPRRVSASLTPCPPQHGAPRRGCWSRRLACAPSRAPSTPSG